MCSNLACHASPSFLGVEVRTYANSVCSAFSRGYCRAEKATLADVKSATWKYRFPNLGHRSGDGSRQARRAARSAPWSRSPATLGGLRGALLRNYANDCDSLRSRRPIAKERETFGIFALTAGPAEGRTP